MASNTEVSRNVPLKSGWTRKSSGETYDSSKWSVLEDNYIYISHLDEGLQFWRIPSSPESISDSMQPSFASVTPLGRSAPVFTYSGTGTARQIQVTLKLHRDLFDDYNLGYSNSELQDNGEDYVDNLIRAIQAIAVPRYNLDNKAVEPPMVAVRFENQIFIKGVVTSAVGITWEKPILTNGKYAIATISFTVSETDPYDASTVYKNGSFRGVVNSLKRGMNLED